MRYPFKGRILMLTYHICSMKMDSLLSIHCRDSLMGTKRLMKSSISRITKTLKMISKNTSLNQKKSNENDPTEDKILPQTSKMRSLVIISHHRFSASHLINYRDNHPLKCKKQRKNRLLAFSQTCSRWATNLSTNLNIYRTEVLSSNKKKTSKK